MLIEEDIATFLKGESLYYIESLGLIYGYEFDGIYQVDDFYTSAATGKLILKPGITNNTRYDGGAAPVSYTHL